MSKSKGNTVDPQTLMDRFGADTVRLFIMFAAPPEQTLEWSDAGVEGASRFLHRLWKAAFRHVSGGATSPLDTDVLNEGQRALRRKVHETLRKVGDDVGRRYTFNTAIAANMELLNEIGKFKDDSAAGRAVLQEALEGIVLMLSPIVPHITHRLWQALGHSDSLVDQAWPEVDENALLRESIELAVQVNGRVRGKIMVAADAGDALIVETALAEANVKRFVQDKRLIKSIVVPGRLVNLVVA